MVTSTAQIFSSVSCVEQLIISERLNQIYIAAHRWKEEILSFPMIYHTSKSVACIKFKGSGYHCSSTCERKSALGINTVSPISIDKSTLPCYLSVFSAPCKNTRAQVKFSRGTSVSWRVQVQLLLFGMYTEEVQDTLQETDVPRLNFTLANTSQVVPRKVVPASKRTQIFLLPSRTLFIQRFTISYPPITKSYPSEF